MGKKPNHDKGWKKGVSGNPSGRRKMPKELRDAKNMFKEDFERAIVLYYYKKESELREILKDDSVNMKDKSVIQLILNAYDKGDNQRVNFLLDRTIGKVKDTLEIQESSHDKLFRELMEDD